MEDCIIAPNLELSCDEDIDLVASTLFSWLAHWFILGMLGHIFSILRIVWVILWLITKLKYKEMDY